MQVIIRNIKQFGTINIQGVHQVVDDEGDIENAVYNAERDGFNRIIFYFSYPPNWMRDHDFRCLVQAARDAVPNVEAWIKDQGIDPKTISFYSMPAESCTWLDELERDDDDDSPVDVEGHYGTCDITGIQGTVVPCMACLKDSGEIIEFEALESLVGGPLGKLAGAF